MSSPRPTLRSFDAFDLPDWIGTEPVTWRAETSLQSGPQVPGLLTAADGRRHQQLDLLAADAAHPRLVCPDSLRHDVHQAWRLGEVSLLQSDDRVVVAAPGTEFDASSVCELLRRFAKSVGAPAGTLTVSIVL